MSDKNRLFYHVVPHIRVALVKAIEHAKEIGTDRDIQEAEYALMQLDRYDCGMPAINGYTRYEIEQLTSGNARLD
jgi:hypothetical protein